MNSTVLFVDDETSVLNAFKRLFVDKDFSLITAESGEAALDILRSDPVAVVVSDYLMPKMTGIEFLERAKAVAPDSIRILMTGNADLNAAIDAINRGEVYRFIIKPWDDAQLVETISNAVSRFNVVTTMRGANEATLLSLAQTIELKDPYTRGHCDRVARFAVMTGERLGLSEPEIRHIRYGSWLHDCGKIGVPESILNFNGPLSSEQMEVVKKHSKWGAEVASLAKLPDPVIGIILCHHEKYDGTGYPNGLSGNDIPHLARIVAIADIYDAMTSDRPYRKAMPKDNAADQLRVAGGKYVDPDILGVFMEIVRDI